MNLLDDDFNKKTTFSKLSNYLPPLGWKVCWYHSCFITIISFCFLFLQLSEYNCPINYLFYLSIIELALFWRYIEFFDDILVSALLSIFGISFGGIALTYLSQFFNFVSPYDWLYISGPYKIEEKTTLHIALEASLFSLFFIIWTLLFPIMKKLWNHYSIQYL